MKWTVPKKGAMNDLCGEGALVRELKQLLSALLPNTASTCCTADERSNTLFGIEEGRRECILWAHTRKEQGGFQTARRVIFCRFYCKQSQLIECKMQWPLRIWGKYTHLLIDVVTPAGRERGGKFEVRG